MKKSALFFLFITLFLNVFAQHERCLTNVRWNQLAQKDPEAIQRKLHLEQLTQNWIKNNPERHKNSAVITIPVVVHVVYNASNENISDAQIFSQMDVLDRDFRLMNSDALGSSHPFASLAADSEIEFCLASLDPNGAQTSGITRTQTSNVSFSGNGDVFYSSYGGVDNWDPTRYMNMYVCNLDASGGTLGFASNPSDLAQFPEEDGVVIDFRAFGTMGTAGTGGFSENDLGRTATHEVGHWLNLEHIWGDANCGNDFVADTPPQETDNFGCPSFPHNANNSCGSGGNGEMYMNYLDYTDDACMALFTSGQKDRMRAALNTARPGILTSNACQGAVGINANTTLLSDVKLYPNPSNGVFSIQVENMTDQNIQAKAYNVLGQLLLTQPVNHTSTTIDLTGKVSKGVIYIELSSDETSITKKVIVE